MAVRQTMKIRTGGLSSREIEVERSDLTAPRVAIRNVYGWQGGQGIANTVTAHCSLCKRRVTVKTTGTPGAQEAELFHLTSSNDHAGSLSVDMGELHEERIKRDH